MVEMEMYEIFSEVHEVDENNRDGTFEYVIKCIDYVLGSEGIMNIVEGIELIEYNEILDSNHRSYLADLNLETHFEEEFTNKQECDLILFNPNKITHRIEFVETCQKHLSTTSIEQELEDVERHKDRENME